MSSAIRTASGADRPGAAPRRAGLAGRAGLASALAELTKARITVVVTLTVAAGQVLFAGAVTPDVLLPMAGVFLLACGGAALNQVEEARTDARMPRTRARPIPSGRIPARWALFTAILLIAGGLDLLAFVPHHSETVVALGALAIVWYNGVYLLLKRWTAFAVVPGALIGAIPPVIGWCAGGGMPLDPRILEVAFFLFLWQIPHFWILLLLYGEEYGRAGLPSLTRLVTRGRFRLILGAWILALAAAGIGLAASLGLRAPFNLAALAASIWLALETLGFLRARDTRRGSLAMFARINLYALAFLAILAADRVL